MDSSSTDAQEIAKALLSLPLDQNPYEFIQEHFLANVPHLHGRLYFALLYVALVAHSIALLANIALLVNRFRQGLIAPFRIVSTPCGRHLSPSGSSALVTFSSLYCVTAITLMISSIAQQGPITNFALPIVLMEIAGALLLLTGWIECWTSLVAILAYAQGSRPNAACNPPRYLAWAPIIINFSFPALIFAYCLAVTMLSVKTGKGYNEINRMTIRGLDLIVTLGENWRPGLKLSLRDLQVISESAQHFFQVALGAVDLIRWVFMLFLVCTSLLLLVWIPLSYLHYRQMRKQVDLVRCSGGSESEEIQNLLMLMRRKSYLGMITLSAALVYLASICLALSDLLRLSTDSVRLMTYYLLFVLNFSVLGAPACLVGLFLEFRSEQIKARMRNPRSMPSISISAFDRVWKKRSSTGNRRPVEAIELDIRMSRRRESERIREEEESNETDKT